MRTVADNFWFHGMPPLETGSALFGEHEADVAIIGGGFTGIAAAYFIKQRFPARRVIVLESEFVGYGSSGRNSGGVTGLLGHSCLHMKKKHGVEKTSRLLQLTSQSVPLLEELIKKHGIDCDYERAGRLVIAETERQVRHLEEQAKASEEVGEKILWLEKGEARSRFGGVSVLAAVHHPDEGVVNPVKFLRGMKKAAESIGVEVYEHSRCTHIEPGPIVSLYTALGTVRARAIVVATNAYGNPLGLFRYKVLPFYIYQIAMEPLTKAQLDEFHCRGQQNVFIAKNLYWATRFTADNRLQFVECDALFFYDMERDYSHRPREYRSHYALMIEKFPFLKGIKVTHQWGGRIGITLDFLPSVGRTGKHENIYYSMGYNGNGLAFGQLAGKMIAALMAGENSELTRNMLINKSMTGVPSASATYLASHGLKFYYKMCDRLLET
ncbi:MAG: FAD-binding oxidoreductase [Candidatus Lindowbacteria bacterium]|nr:FAD-binding oxidoreductase [Candidatus Lindowbacteria bacterium]